MNSPWTADDERKRLEEQDRFLRNLRKHYQGPNKPKVALSKPPFAPVLPLKFSYPEHFVPYGGDPVPEYQVKESVESLQTGQNLPRTTFVMIGNVLILRTIDENGNPEVYICRLDQQATKASFEKRPLTKDEVQDAMRGLIQP